eukprot:CAMPEP_0202459758 /NCGR_PEP_ID=MMETSP1360-20130828/38554_1 /ASSEMBLY_ACC=CAM_ASM_000848 /TAXON_ID=515479 /ORGANISM="Licmophora paradoxa, Strain CCMP2313" /LENGTH=260 /DNA_ID=CAMNT_0049081029 /DNA_START=1 /DNA_END=783 /DNA_ORIENTATION=+
MVIQKTEDILVENPSSDIIQQSIMFVRNDFHRFLEEEAVVDASKSLQSDKVVFWSINGLWLSVLIMLVIFFWKCNGSERLQRWMRSSQDSDRAFVLRERQRRRAEEDAKKITPEKRLAMLKKAFRRENVLMTVDADSLIDTNGQSDLDIESGAGDSSPDLSADKEFLLLQTSDQRMVPNCCAVCLGTYDVGENVVWSANPDCSHAFHEDCVTDWLIKMQDGNPCPCCRQSFVFIAEDDAVPEKTVRWASGHAMDVGRVSL